MIGFIFLIHTYIRFYIALKRHLFPLENCNETVFISSVIVQNQLIGLVFNFFKKYNVLIALGKWGINFYFWLSDDFERRKYTLWY